MELRIILDGPNREYQLGEAVDGVLEVDCSEDSARKPTLRCNSVVVSLVWYTEAKGIQDKRQVDSVEVEGAHTFARGQVHRYPFQLKLPKSPRPYDGEIVSVGYRLEARADLPSAEHTTTTTTTTELAVAGPKVGRTSTIAHNWRKEESLAVAFICAGLLGLCLSGLWVAFFGVPPLIKTYFFIGTLVSMVFFGVGLGDFLRERKVGLVDLEIEHVRTNGYRDGRALGRLAVALVTPRLVDGLRASVALGVVEYVVGGSDDRHEEHNHVLYERQAEMTESQPGRFETLLDLPKENSVPHSFYASGYEIQWHLYVELEIPGAVDWSKRIRLHTSSVASEED